MYLHGKVIHCHRGKSCFNIPTGMSHVLMCPGGRKSCINVFSGEVMH